MKRMILIVPLFLLLAGCGQKTENNSSDDTPIDTYRRSIDRAQEVQQRSNQRVKNLDSLSQGGQ